MDEAIRRLPKAELHVHAEAMMTPDYVRAKAKEKGIKLDDDIFTPDGRRFTWKDFSDCVMRVYDQMASVITTAQDYEDITYDYLKRSAAENCIYTEIIISPDHCERIGIPYKDMVDAMARGIDRARADFDIEARMNATIVRHLPMETVQNTADIIISYPHPYVVGLDLAGAEKSGDIAQFRPVFKKIKDATDGRMGWRMHASEAAGPENARQAIDMHVTRIGHGVRAIEDPELVDELVRRKTVLEESLTSNDLAGIYSFDKHPVRKLYDAGVRICLNTDDPGLFDCTIGSEYQLAHDKFGFTERELVGITRTAIEAAFADEPTRQKLLKKVDDYDFFLTRRPVSGPQPPRL